MRTAGDFDRADASSSGGSGSDLAKADLTIAVKEAEHRPLIRWKFPEWEERVEYWEVHDLDVAAAEVGLAELRVRVEELVNRLV